MNPAKLILTTLLTFWITATAAQNTGLEDKDNREVLRMGLYPPDILMRQQQKLGITSEQRTGIAALVHDFQGEVTELQWAMPNEQQKLRKLLSEPKIDPELALAQAGQVLEMESRFKLAHFDLLIAIKNTLTEAQIEMLDRVIRRRVSQD